MLTICKASCSAIEIYIFNPFQIFEWWYFRKYGTSFIEQVSLNHISPWLGGGDNNGDTASNGSSGNEGNGNGSCNSSNNNQQSGSYDKFIIFL